MTKVKSITTKIGDKGHSRLFSGEEVSKTSPRLEAYGDIDELVAVLGIARSHARKQETKEALLFIQQSLFTVASELATTPPKLSKLPQRVDSVMLDILEKRRVDLENQIQIPNGFVIPGDNLGVASIEHARTVARRCERKIVRLVEEKTVTNETLLVWFNRLSDYLYLLARSEEEKTRLA